MGQKIDNASAWEDELLGDLTCLNKDTDGVISF